MNSITEPTTELINEQSKIQAVVHSLRTLLEGDEQEQRETFEYLKQVLEEDRPSNRRLLR
jgi:lipid A disaccharide synthetase